MNTTNRRVPLVTLLVSLALALSVAGGPFQGVSEAAPGDTFSAFLPMVTRPLNTIFGYVTDNGAAAAGVTLELWYDNGATSAILMTTVTGANGYYQFQPVPPLGAGESYWVRYENEVNSARLYEWYTRELTSFPDGSQVNIGNFDIANVTMTTPAAGSKILLPQSFQWTPRPATLTDSYQFEIFDFFDMNPSYSTSPLGYVGSYNLVSLPGGFQYCNPYFWGVRVNSPDGGTGYSYWAYGLTIHQSAHSGIHGCVTENAVPVSNVTVELCRYSSGHVCISLGTDVTSSGYFEFTGKPSLLPGERYYVQ